MYGPGEQKALEERRNLKVVSIPLPQDRQYERSRSQERQSGSKKRGRPRIYISHEERYKRKLERDRNNQKNYRQRKNKEIKLIEEQNQQLKSCMMKGGSSSTTFEHILEAKAHMRDQIKTIRELVSCDADQDLILQRLNGLETYLEQRELFTLKTPKSFELARSHFIDELFSLSSYIMRQLTEPPFLDYLHALTENQSVAERSPSEPPRPHPGRPAKSNDQNQSPHIHFARMSRRLCSDPVQASHMLAFIKQNVLPLNARFDKSMENLNKAIDEVYEWSQKYTQSLKEIKDSFLYPNQHLLLLEQLDELDRLRTQQSEPEKMKSPMQIKREEASGVTRLEEVKIESFEGGLEFDSEREDVFLQACP